MKKEKKVTRLAVLDELGRVVGLLPERYRDAPKGKFEYGPIWWFGRRVDGVGHVETVFVRQVDIDSGVYKDFSPDLIGGAV